MSLPHFLIFLSCSPALSLAGPLDTTASLNSEPFIIIAQSQAGDLADIPDTVSGETVQIVTPSSSIPQDRTKPTTPPPVIKLSSSSFPSSSSSSYSPQPSSSPSTKIVDNSHWEEITSFNVSSSLPVYKYRSRLTGLTVVLARAESPIVNGYFCLATEAEDNDGLPHTLEHLVFLGSEDYPYKEVLDLLANRCLADRTNAWTDTDHTCYTVYTAGPSGFLHILPVYMDHILYPSLREEDYLTEVHHVNGEGRDTGVVYSEMQGVETSSSNMMYFALAKRLYPNSGYNAETGGYLDNLRTSTSIAKVRHYHETYYRPENLVLTITGRIDEQQLFDTLRTTEEKVLRKRELKSPPPFQRPWQKPLQQLNLTEDLIVEIDYPSDDETVGNVAVAWRLPQEISEDIEMLEAYQLVMKYLTNTQVSPFEAEFVDTSDPLATSVSTDTLEIKEPSLLIEFENVPLERITEVIPKMDAVLEKIVGDGPDKFDLERIHNYIDREMVNNLKEIENSPHLFLPDASVLDMLYGEKPDHLKKFVTMSQSNRKYRDKNATFWINLIDRVFIKNYKVALLGRPSSSLVQTLTEKEEARIERQINDLGPEGLEDKERIIEAAIDSQMLPGMDVLTKIPLGDVDTIQFREFDSFNRTLNENRLFNFSEIPFKIHIDDVNSNFVQINIFFDTTVLSRRQRKLLPMLLDLWLASPLLKNGQQVPIDTVVKRRTKTLLYLDATLGFSGSTFSPGAYGDAVIIEAQAERSKFTEAIEFLRDAINFPLLTEKKVNSTAANIVNLIPSMKLSATDVLRSLSDGLYFNRESNIYHTSILRQKKVLDGVLEKIKTAPGEMITELAEIISVLARPENAFVYLATDSEELRNTYGPSLPVLHNLFNESSTSTTVERQELETRYEIPSEHRYRRGRQEARPQHVVFGVGGTESCFLKQWILYNNTDWSDSEVADTRVMLQYLSDRMYDEVRGLGLTYGVSMSLSVTEGRLTLSFTRSSRLSEAYRTFVEIIRRYVTDDNEWDETLADSAKGSIIYSWAEKEETVEDLVGQALKAYMRDTDSKYNRQFVRALGRVQLDGIKAAARSLLPTFLATESTQTVVVCNPSSVEDVIVDFKEFGIQLSTYPSLEESFLNEDS